MKMMKMCCLSCYLAPGRPICWPRAWRPQCAKPPKFTKSTCSPQLNCWPLYLFTPKLMLNHSEVRFSKVNPSGSKLTAWLPPIIIKTWIATVRCHRSPWKKQHLYSSKSIFLTNNVEHLHPNSPSPLIITCFQRASSRKTVSNLPPTLRGAKSTLELAGIKHFFICLFL